MLLFRTTTLAMVAAIMFTSSHWLTASSHEVVNGLPRAELVFEPTAGQNDVKTVQGHVEYQNPTLTGPAQWSWIGVSMTKPTNGDCHSGDTDPQFLKALRAGFMKYHNQNWNNGNTVYMFAAWIDENNNIVLEKHMAVNQMYPMRIDDYSSSIFPRSYYFRYYNGSKWKDYRVLLNDGPMHHMRCTTYGGWASNHDQGMGTAGILYPTYRKQSGGTFTQVPFNPWHADASDPFWISHYSDPNIWLIQIGRN
ncbi:MAG: hypothetical protein KDE50_12415 [Caldilineaceae bacterium]|nr:hypothetical protein [Caldilineaceae bacterium]